MKRRCYLSATTEQLHCLMELNQKETYLLCQNNLVKVKWNINCGLYTIFFGSLYHACTHAYLTMVPKIDMLTPWRYDLLSHNLKTKKGNHDCYIVPYCMWNELTTWNSDIIRMTAGNTSTGRTSLAVIDARVTAWTRQESMPDGLWCLTFPVCTNANNHHSVIQFT